MATDHIVENARERERLGALLDSLTDDDLSFTLDNGLTIAVVLVHMAYWDDYCTALIRQWSRTGPTASRSNFEAVNEALGHLAAVVPVASARELARTAAAIGDAAVEALSADLAAALVDGAGSDLFIRRSVHRRVHLDQIEDAVNRRRGRAAETPAPTSVEQAHRADAAR